MEADFSGYATKAGLKCSDGLTIMPEAFKHMDGMKVPLVWQHIHNDTNNILGHGILEARDDGMYVYGFFNETPAGKKAKEFVKHGDVESLSIWANRLVKRSQQIFHGMIREVSLVMSGANPGAKIDYVSVAHGDGDIETMDDEAIIFTGLELEHENLKQSDDSDEEQEDSERQSEGQEESNDSEELSHKEGETIQDVLNTLTPKQKNVVAHVIGAALEEARNSDDSVQQSSTNTDEEDLVHQEGTDEMSRNVFEQQAQNDSVAHTAMPHRKTLTRDQIKTIFEDAEKLGSFKESFLAHADEYGITDIEFLFPDAKTLQNTPHLMARRTEWVAGVMSGTKHTPFSRVKSLVADVTADEARAKGYVKGNLKKDEVIKLLKRVTTPTTVYKKQKLDRDDVVDITDLDVVAWLKWEMRFMLEEEIARAILVGDGREPDDDDKIDEEKLRPIAWDHDMYAHSVTVAENTTPDALVEVILRARKNYRGSGSPALYTSDDILTDMMLLKDKMGRRLYNTEVELAAALRVSKIVVADVFEDNPDLLGVIVNLSDYVIGADKGGQVNMFDDFDIDYNQQKYLIETRISGALVKPKSALVFKRTAGTLVVAAAPLSDFENNKLTIPNVTGVDYYDVTSMEGDGTLLTAGDVYHLTGTVDIEARAATGYSFGHNTDNDWTFAFNADGDVTNAAADPEIPS